jgi:hypothetical protein
MATTGECIDEAEKWLVAQGAFEGMYEGLVGRSVLQLYALLATQGHSGGSWQETLECLCALSNSRHNSP